MTTYLDMINLGLEDINETPLTITQFSSPRGIQKTMKGFVNRVYFDIANESSEWPWLQNTVSRVEGTSVLETTQGVQWYDMDDTTLEVDWLTFYLTDKDPTVSSASPPKVSKSLTYLTYDQWAREYRNKDNQRVPEQQGTPSYVIRHPNGKIGISQVPDDTYYIEYFLWKSATSFSAYDDVIPIPEEFNNVFIHRLRYYLWLFRENTEQANLANRDYGDSLASMKRLLLSNKSERMRAV